MRDCSSLKQEFLKKWIKGLKACKSSWINSNKEVTILERKKAIKLSADVAMASARDGTTFWSRAVIANAAQDNNDDAVEVSSSSSRWASSVMHKKILKKSRSRRRVVRSRRSGLIKMRRVHVRDDVLETNLIAKRLLVKKKTQVLKSLVPGGELMDEMALIAEALDYIVSLRAQVDVMRCVATTSHQLIISIGK